MRVASTIARYLLGILFTFFGLNGFLHFLPMTPMPDLATQFVTLLSASHYMAPIFLIQVCCGLLFLVNRYVPLALAFIAPVIFNILLFHITMAPAGIVLGLVATICWFIVFYSLRGTFAGLFVARPLTTEGRAVR